MHYCRFTAMLLLLLLTTASAVADDIVIKNDPKEKNIVFGNNMMLLTLSYNNKCVATGLRLNGQDVISGASGMYASVKTPGHQYNTLQLKASPNVTVGKNSVTIGNISYGEQDEITIERWIFTITENDIRFNIERRFPKPFTIEEAAFPSFGFNSIKTWNGAFLGFGGLAWFYLFNEPLCTYGVHTNTATFWNSDSGIGLKLKVEAPGKEVAMKFTRSADDRLLYNLSVSGKELTPRYEKEKRSRFIRKKTDVWDAFTVPAEKYSQSITLSYVNYHETYDRGRFAGINGKQVTDVLNTIARIGVIDKNHFGGNSWHTPYGPLCLHEQYIAQFAIGINDVAYLRGYSECLDYYRDHALQPDGRVIARWAYLDEDAIPGTVTPQGFYEAQWGYLMDSNPDFVANVSQMYDLTGDLQWVSRHKKTCEMALDYMLKRDANGNHLVEMMTDSHLQRKGSDWIDILWASYENAFVNAKLYYALTLWAEIERQLNDTEKADYYANYAAEMKKSFNKPVKEGGFWSNANKWYVHWLDKDGSVHGDNLVMPVNLMAIVYGICDDSTRSHAILDKIEEQTRKENLFFWPICLYPYAVGEGNDWQFPFPNYENGDLFLSWGSIGVEAFARYKPDIALKYVQNVLRQYEKDGLAFQRYGRVNQDGLGDDILSGNSLTLVGLYKAIYGINPLYNRLYLDPHLPGKLSGTSLFYNFRGDKLKIDLSSGRYAIANNQFRVSTGNHFGFSSGKNELLFFSGNDARFSLRAQTSISMALDILQWNGASRSWSQSATAAKGKVNYVVRVDKASAFYTVTYGNQKMKLRSDKAALLQFSVNATPASLGVTVAAE